MAAPEPNERQIRERIAAEARLREENEARAVEAEHEFRRDAAESIAGVVLGGLGDRSEETRMRVMGLVGRGIEKPDSLKGWRIGPSEYPGHNVLLPPGEEPAGEGETFDLSEIITTQFRSKRSARERAQRSAAHHAEGQRIARELQEARAAGDSAKVRELDRARIEHAASSPVNAPALDDEPVNAKEAAEVLPAILAPFANEDARLGLTPDQLRELARAVASGDRKALDTLRVVRMPVPSPLSEAERQRLAHQLAAENKHEEAARVRASDKIEVTRLVQWQPGDAIPAGRGVRTASLRELLRSAEFAVRLKRRWGPLWRRAFSVYTGKGPASIYHGVLDGGSEAPGGRVSTLEALS